MSASVTTQARRIARWSNEFGEPGYVGLYDRDGRFLEWVCGPGVGSRLKREALGEGLVLYRTSHGFDRWADVQREIDEQRNAHCDLPTPPNPDAGTARVHPTER